MKFLLDLISDKNGQPSMQRFLSLLLAISGIVYAFIFHDIGIASLLIGTAVTGKVVQKVME
jgi:hypothetical protein